MIIFNLYSMVWNNFVLLFSQLDIEHASSFLQIEAYCLSSVMARFPFLDEDVIRTLLAFLCGRLLILINQVERVAQLLGLHEAQLFCLKEQFRCAFFLQIL